MDSQSIQHLGNNSCYDVCPSWQIQSVVTQVHIYCMDVKESTPVYTDKTKRWCLWAKVGGKACFFQFFSTVSIFLVSRMLLQMLWEPFVKSKIMSRLTWTLRFVAWGGGSGGEWCAGHDVQDICAYCIVCLNNLHLKRKCSTMLFHVFWRIMSWRGYMMKLDTS